MATTTKLSITLSPDAITGIDARLDREGGNRSGVISRDLNRYYETLRRARAVLRGTFPQPEINLIADSLNGTMNAEASLLYMTWAGVQDSIEMDGLDKKWEVNGAALINRLKNLTFAENAALVDAVERWWNRVGRGENPGFEEILAD